MSKELTMVTWTTPKLQLFKKAYKQAIKSGQEMFVFEGHDFLVPYSKYLIEYLEERLGP